MNMHHIYIRNLHSDGAQNIIYIEDSYRLHLQKATHANKARHL